MTALLSRGDRTLRRMVRIGAAMAIAGGIVDVSLAMLHRPRSFENFASLPAPIVAAAGVLLLAYCAACGIGRILARKGGIAAESVDVAVASFIGTGFTLALLAGLHTTPLSPHLALKAVIVGLLTVVMSAGVCAVHDKARQYPGVRRRGVAIGLALPVVLFEVLFYQWVMVYAVDSVPAWVAVIATAAAVLAAVLTVALFLRTRLGHAPVRVLAVFVLFLLGWPILGAGSARKAPVAAERAPRLPRVLLISVDTLRADVLSSYAPTVRATGNIDRLARDGVLFEHAVAPSPWTLPSVASILTGLSPSEHLATGFQTPLSTNVTTLAEHLGGRNYYTAAIVHNALLHKGNNLTQGFDEYVDLYQPWFGESVGARLLQRLLPASFPSGTWPKTADITQRVADWLDVNRERPFFLWVHYLDPHAPYEPPREYLRGEPTPNVGLSFEGQRPIIEGLVVPTFDDRRWIRALYDAEVAYLDAAIGQLIATLERLDLYDDTLIVFTSDHGEEFWEHGSQGHGHSLYNEVLRVPLIVKLPGSSHRGRTGAVVSTASVTPTVLDIVGLQYDENSLSAPSLARLLRPAAEAFDQLPVVSTAQALFDRRESVVFDGFKYVVSRINGREELFDVTTDPGDERSLAESNPDKVAHGRALLEQHAERADALRKRIRIDQGMNELDDDLMKRLRSLGYIR